MAAALPGSPARSIPSLNLVYWGTGNAGSDFYDRARVPGGDKSKDVNLYTASVVALDADTGKLRWHYQEVPDDVWDFDSSYESILIDREIKGRMRKLLVHMNKSGLTFVLDRATGEFLGVFSVPEVQNWITGVTEDGKLVGRREPEPGKPLNYCPSVAGAKSWNSMAYSPRTGFIYMPLNELCNNVTATSDRRQGRRPVHERRVRCQSAAQPHHIQPSRRVGPRDRQTHLELSLQVRAAGFGACDGRRSRVHGRSRRILLRAQCAHRREALELQTGAGNRGSAISYAVNGRQYIATPTGWQGSLIGGAAAALFPGTAMAHGFDAGGIRAAAVIQQVHVARTLSLPCRHSCRHVFRNSDVHPRL